MFFFSQICTWSDMFWIFSNEALSHCLYYFTACLHVHLCLCAIHVFSSFALSVCPCLCSCKVKCINLSLSNPLFVMRSHNVGTHVEPRRTQKSDRLIAHSDAPLCFAAACANSHNSEIERLRLREEDTFDLSVCQYVDKNQGCIFDLFFLSFFSTQPTNDLTTC